MVVTSSYPINACRAARGLVVVTACLLASLSAAAQDTTPEPNSHPTDSSQTGPTQLTGGPTQLVGASDPLAIPLDAGAAELFDFIRSVERRRETTRESYLQSARVVAEAAMAIRRLEDVKLSDELAAIRKQIEASRTIALIGGNEDRDALAGLLDSLSTDKRQSIAKLVQWESLRSQIRGVSSLNDGRQDELRQRHLDLITKLQAMLAEHPFDRDAFVVASSLARVVSYSNNTDLAASLYDDLAEIMSQSSEESYRRRADKMKGAARRMRLPGKVLEISGTTTEGKPFDWKAYRGKVVLNWYWASWCRRCRAEVAAHQRLQQRYGDQGFEIVGINLDKRLEDCREYIQERDITWTNLFSNQQGEQGWNNPMAREYGVTAIPTAILIDRDGKVVTLNARGSELESLLEQLFAGKSAGQPSH